MTIGGQGIVAQMQAIDADHADELLEAYKEHNDGLHETLEAFDELLALLPRAARRRDGSSGSSRPSGTGRSRSHSSAFPRSRARSTSSSRTRTRAGTSPIPSPSCSRSRSSGRTPDEAVYVGDSPFDIRAAKAAGVYRRRASAGVGSTPTSDSSPRSRTRSCGLRRSSSMSSRTASRPRTERPSSRRLVEHHNYRYHVLDDPELDRQRVRRALRRAPGARDGRTRSSSRPTRRPSASARRPRRASARSSTSRRWGRSRR